MQYFLIILALPFAYLNYKIIASDIQNQTIPNKYLGWLLSLAPFYYIILFLQNTEISYLLFCFQIILTLIIGFVLYVYDIWAAGDAKYLTVLALFVPHIWVIPLLGNLGLLILLWISLYFIWFCTIKPLYSQQHRKQFIGQVYHDLNDKWEVYKQSKSQSPLRLILWWLWVFLCIFVAIRLSRIYLFASLSNSGTIGWISITSLFEQYHIYALWFCIAMIIAVIYIIRLVMTHLKVWWNRRISQKHSPLFVQIGITTLYIGVLSFIVYEYRQDPQVLMQSMVSIATVSICIYIVFRILYYAYIVTFQINEQYYLKSSDLQAGMIIDKKFLMQMFGLLNAEKTKNTLPSIREKIRNINSILQPDDIIEIQNILQLSHKNKKKFSDNMTPLTKVKILHSFAFAPYIFFWGSITFLIWDTALIYIIEQITSLFIHLYK